MLFILGIASIVILLNKIKNTRMIEKEKEIKKQQEEEWIKEREEKETKIIDYSDLKKQSGRKIHNKQIAYTPEEKKEEEEPVIVIVPENEEKKEEKSEETIEDLEEEKNNRNSNTMKKNFSLLKTIRSIDKHNLTAMVGYEAEKRNLMTLTASSQNYSTHKLPELSVGKLPLVP